MKKGVKIIIAVAAALIAACLLGLIITGAVIGWGPFAFIKYNKKPICLAEEKQKYTAEDIWLKNGSKNIFGTLYKAESGNKNQPIAILSHGYNGNSVYNKFIAKSLASSGISVYAFDFCGGGTKSKSDGETNDMSVITETGDLNAVIEQVKNWDWVDKENIFLIGESQGGCVSALVAAKRDDIPNRSRAFMGMAIGKKYYEDILGMDIYGEIAGFKNPVLIMHGTADNVVDYSYSEKANRVYENSELVAFEKAGHGFNSEDSEKAVKYAYDFISENIK